MRDKQGVSRGRCTQCNCPEYITHQHKVRCQNCNHAPTKHEGSREDVGQGNNATNDSDYYDDVQWESAVNLASASPSHFSPRPVNVGQAWEDDTGRPHFSDSETFDNSGVPLCSFPGCNDTREFDLNTGLSTSEFCYNHLSAVPIAYSQGDMIVNGG